MPTLLPQVAPEVVVMTTYSATKVGIMMTLSFHCLYYNVCQEK